MFALGVLRLLFTFFASFLLSCDLFSCQVLVHRLNFLLEKIALFEEPVAGNFYPFWSQNM